MFPISDAYLYYALIRSGRPNRIMEVGSGQSTLIALKALGTNQSGSITCIEPNPNQHFNAHLVQISKSNFELITNEIQEIPVEYFVQLKKGDMLFIDSSHVVKAQSDLLYTFFKIIPKLASGVLVHFHDIFLPTIT